MLAFVEKEGLGREEGGRRYEVDTKQGRVLIYIRITNANIQVCRITNPTQQQIAAISSELKVANPPQHKFS